MESYVYKNKERIQMVLKRNLTSKGLEKIQRSVYVKLLWKQDIRKGVTLVKNKQI